MNGNSSICKPLGRFLRAGLLAFSLLLLLPAPDAFADSLREVAERVARQHDGKVIAAREVRRGGRRYYEIRILTRDGVVKNIRVPARDQGSLAGAVEAGFDRDGNPADVAIRGSRPQQHNSAFRS
ncbi:MAG: hypothetical protein CVV18_02210 [Gammaproteobacteria bacterium HGW-Gammaproteobacteria-8]|nr:MAG: hypothetical protein CVV18_02210 [Gammaproteobacteria bacterium HGW-Gammaproteobacteria-8]